ncbi:MAG: hypothetical protein WA446_12325 [Steroidobacteraceae bacterium]
MTGGVYYSLTKNLMLLGEVSYVQTTAHDDHQNTCTDFSFGAFPAF